MNFLSSVDSSSVARAHASERSFSPSRGRILLIEDDREIAEEVTNELLDRAYDVSQVATGSAGTEEARCGGYDLLIVDLLLPGCDGISIIRELRRDHIQVPVLVVSALGAITDRVRALKTGCDDYVTKPFALSELAARVEALLRRPLETRATTLRGAAGTRSDRTGRPARGPNDRTVEDRVQAARVFASSARSRGDPRHAAGRRVALPISSPDQSRRRAYRTVAPKDRWSGGGASAAERPWHGFYPP
jgi:DNA-binding response OmpR family regulator